MRTAIKIGTQTPHRKFRVPVLTLDFDQRSFSPAERRKLLLLRRSLAVRFPFLTGSMSFTVVGVRAMQKLNREFRHRDRPTNVLSFPTMDTAMMHKVFPELRPTNAASRRRLREKPKLRTMGEWEWGDVFLCRSVIAKEARQGDEPETHRLMRLAIHGCLHLLGFDHEHNIEAKAMEAMEDELYNKLC